MAQIWSLQRRRIEALLALINQCNGPQGPQTSIAQFATGLSSNHLVAQNLKREKNKLNKTGHQ